MSQYDTVVEVLSERMASSKLKRMSITHSKDSSISEVRFVFEGDKGEERVVIVWGEDLGMGFGRRRI